MLEWAIVIPAWGERCVGCFLDVGLPAIKAALDHSGSKARFLVYTDQPQPLDAALASFQRTLRSPPSGVNQHRVLGRCHLHAVRSVKAGTVLAFINADNVPSIEAFAACERRIAEGKKLIMCAGTRTWAQARPPLNARSRDLLQWAWTNRHPWITDCIWGSGRSAQPATIHFERNGSVVTHGFHLHPFAVVIDGRKMDFAGATVDDDLPMRFAPHEIHVVTDADEMALAEMSPQHIPRLFNREGPISVESVQAWAHEQWPSGRPRVNAMHKFFFQHAIRIVGKDDAGDAEPCAAILASI
jgi:hypothetical protein